MSELTSPQAVNGSNIRNMKWTDAYDDVLLCIMLEMRKEGKVMPGGFTSEGWGLITKEMQTKLGPQFSKDNLKNRVKSFKKWYSAMKAMLNLSGFGWDEERKKVTAEDAVWDDYIKAHAGASMYRSRRMPDYYIMCEIFGDSIADDVATRNEEAGDEHISRATGRNIAPEGSSHQTTKRQSTGDAMVAVVGRMADAIDTLARNTSEEQMKKVWEALLPLDLEPMVKIGAFRQLGNEEMAS
ncbi:Myb/SANT-like domain-containing protein [Cinnamomum micranthum f. kanehirae]|uniref:Myb/SANT-like domain-containing protein n=1 Tax=Cinnamomum micranthum f. kanehirae TaxID=337451 RepID=A0A3S3PLA4_9MAGN|nr:Myb/SANT-like domain-containing protein [Cinnamomum micranthum f. kanehirae]